MHCLEVLNFSLHPKPPPQSSSHQKGREIWRPHSLGHSWKACSSSQQKCLSLWEQGSLWSLRVRVVEERRRLLQPLHAHHQAQPPLSPVVKEGRIKSSPHIAQTSHFTLFTGMLFSCRKGLANKKKVPEMNTKMRYQQMQVKENTDARNVFQSGRSVANCLQINSGWQLGGSDC